MVNSIEFDSTESRRAPCGCRSPRDRHERTSAAVSRVAFYSGRTSADQTERAREWFRSVPFSNRSRAPALLTICSQRLVDNLPLTTLLNLSFFPLQFVPDSERRKKLSIATHFRACLQNRKLIVSVVLTGVGWFRSGADARIRGRLRTRSTPLPWHWQRFAKPGRAGCGSAARWQSGK